MATSIDTATSTGTDRRMNGLKQPDTINLKNANAPATTESKESKRIVKKYKHVAAAHSKARASCLSLDAESTPSFLGFRNLMVIVLHLVIAAVLYFLIPCHLFAAYVIELAAAQQARVSLSRSQRKNDGSQSPTPTEEERKSFNRLWVRIAWAHGINSTLCLAITSLVVYHFVHHPLIGSLTEVHSIIVWLKSASFALTNRDLRHAYLHPSQREEDALPAIYAQCPYPQNITLGNICYFWWSPTLVYQPCYPRSESPVRWLYVGKRALEVVGLSIFIWVASAQYAAPLLQNSLDKMAQLDLVSIAERVMKLSTISLVCWLAGFFALFQSFLNALAEVMRFGDREFYTDWWNSPDLGTYWRTWNKPVYTFMRRHVFSPLIGRGWGTESASIIVFLFSGVLHELLVGVPTHNIIGIAFIGMVIQIPLIQITQPIARIPGHSAQILGNTIFWVSFTLIGQPLAAMIYFFAWQAKYGSVSGASIITA